MRIGMEKIWKDELSCLGRCLSAHRLRPSPKRTFQAAGRHKGTILIFTGFFKMFHHVPIVFSYIFPIFPSFSIIVYWFSCSIIFQWFSHFSHVVIDFPPKMLSISYFDVRSIGRSEPSPELWRPLAQSWKQRAPVLSGGAEPTRLGTRWLIWDNAINLVNGC